MTEKDDVRVLEKDPFEEYIKVRDPEKRELGYAWHTAIGLQSVDGLTTSEYLRETAQKNIEGELSLPKAQELIAAYYRTGRKNESPRTAEADIVSSRIAAILSEKGFTLSPAQYLSIHKRLFEGVFDHAGKMRDYNITKAEWVLDGDTVTYGGFQELRATLEYDISTEREFDYSGLSMEKIIKHLATFISRLWQIHVFGEGNTRATAVFFILYLRSLGFDVTNDTFAKNAWYFRNAMVRANYTNLRKGVRETTEYLELFLRNLLMGESNTLQNRSMHISGDLAKQDSDTSKQDFETPKQNSDTAKQDFDLFVKAGLSVKSANNALKLYQHFGFERPFGRSDIIELLGITRSPSSELINKLLSVGAIEPAEQGRGKYCFNKSFFTSI